MGLELFLDTSVKIMLLAVQQMAKNYYLMGIKHWKLLFGSKESRITFLICLADAVVQNCQDYKSQSPRGNDEMKMFKCLQTCK